MYKRAMTEAVPTQDAYDPDESYNFTTLRWDPALVDSAANTGASCNQPSPFYMLEHHQARLRESSSIDNLTALRDTLSSEVQQWHLNHPNEAPESLRVKHRIYASGHTMTEITPTTRISLDTLFPASLNSESLQPALSIPYTVTLNKSPTTPDHHTSYKTSNRISYDRARASANIISYAEPKEVLLYNPSGEVMDGSITTPYFLINDQWITPAKACGGQQGTTRRWALAQGLCKEGVVNASLLQTAQTGGQTIWLSNGVRGFFPARIKAHELKDLVSTA